MDRNLANYLFLGETLYHFEEAVGEVKTSAETKGLENKPSPVSEAQPRNKPTPQPTVQTSPAPSQKAPIKVYPMKTKHLVVVKNLKPAEEDLLVKIMTAIKLKMDIIDLVDVNHFPEIDFKETIYGNMPKAILFFGPDSGEEFLVRLKLEKYMPKVLKGIIFLMADNLGLILQNKQNEKRQLWESLKKVFNV
ncbi:hypothetical protein [Jiulongibacter sp. NS-SX5]|uniref:hypothetical protein n=1 Tax=Jiulongibacter sp. NS-SX5 TaxID=3463854 RepID=UPI00405999D4